MPRYRFSVARFHVLRNGQTLPAVACGGGGRLPRTAMSRVIVPHPAGARSRCERRVPRSCRRRRDLGEPEIGRPAVPRRAISPRRCRRARSAKARHRAASPRRRQRATARPSTARSATDSTASPAASSQAPDAVSARASAAEKWKNVPAISSVTVVAAANWRVGNNGASLSPSNSARTSLGKFWLNHGSPQLQQHKPFLVIERAFLIESVRLTCGPRAQARSNDPGRRNGLFAWPRTSCRRAGSASWR